MVRFVQVVSNEKNYQFGHFESRSKIYHMVILKADWKNLAFGHFEAYWKFDHLEGQIELNWMFFSIWPFWRPIVHHWTNFQISYGTQFVACGWPMGSLKVCRVGLFIEFFIFMGPSTVCPSYTQEWMLLFVVRKGTNETIPHLPQAGWVRIPFLL